MAEFTEHYSLIKPGEADYYDVADWNENMDTLDAALAENETRLAATAAEVDGVSEKIGTAADEGDTLFGKVNQIQSSMGQGGFIKSLQRLTYSGTSGSSGATLSCNEIDPTKTLVLMERLADGTNSGCEGVAYSLSATGLTISHDTTYASRLKFAFWLIEFN